MRRKYPAGARGFVVLEVVTGLLSGAMYLCPSVDVARRAALELQAVYGVQWVIWQYDDAGRQCVLDASPDGLPY